MEFTNADCFHSWWYDQHHRHQWSSCKEKQTTPRVCSWQLSFVNSIVGIIWLTIRMNKENKGEPLRVLSPWSTRLRSLLCDVHTISKRTAWKRMNTTFMSSSSTMNSFSLLLLFLALANNVGAWQTIRGASRWRPVANSTTNNPHGALASLPPQLRCLSRDNTHERLSDKTGLLIFFVLFLLLVISLHVYASCCYQAVPKTSDGNTVADSASSLSSSSVRQDNHDQVSSLSSINQGGDRDENNHATRFDKDVKEAI